MTRSRSGTRGKAASGGRPLAGVALVAAVITALVTSSRGSGSQDLTVAFDPGSQVVEFRGQSLAGSTVDSVELRGMPIVLNFYASWCTVCDRELPDFQRVSERLAGRVQVLGANPQSNDTDSAQAQMIERSKVTYPTFADPSDELLRQFNTTGGLPTTVFIDAEGVVRKVHNELLTEQLLLEEIDRSLGVRA
ncbi:MAG: TlpA family protein disulfide reductase [Pseudorhodobacter sp.]|nr:TlpA family protein disulfide reductase [Frankiaceae bacterium]